MIKISLKLAVSFEGIILKLSIIEYYWKTNALVRHHGNTLKGGHYTAMLRNEDNNWINFDDNNRPSQEQFPRHLKGSFLNGK